MKLATMFEDIVASIVHRPVTQQYPAERRAMPDGVRGMLTWDKEKCVGCGLCAKDCPSGALEFFVLDRKEKKFVMHYLVDQCLFCGQCAASCRQGAISLANEEWELAALESEPFEHFYGHAEDVSTVVAQRSHSSA